MPMTATTIAAVPTMDGGAFDADWLLQPQGEARRLEAALRSFAERGFDGPQYTAWPTEVDGCPAYGLRIISQAGIWSDREWTVTCVVTIHGVWPGEREYRPRQEPIYRGGPTLWTRGRTGDALFEGGAKLRDRLELPMLRHLAVIGIRTVMPSECSLPGDEGWLPRGWSLNGDTLEECNAEGDIASIWRYTDDEYGVGTVRREWALDPGEPEVHALQYIGYHVAGRLAGVEDPHGVYAQRQAEFEAELELAQRDAS